MFDWLTRLLGSSTLDSVVEEKGDDDHVDADSLSALMKQWETVVGVQKHFNDLEWRIRGLALTALSAIVGYSLSASVASRTVQIYGVRIGVTALLAFLGALVWTAFFMSDYKWYHPMLGGAGLAANTLEETLAKRVGIHADEMLSHRIYKASKESAWRKGRETHSGDKLRWFYGIGYLVLALVMLWSLWDVNEAVPEVPSVTASSPSTPGARAPSSPGVTATP